MRLGVGSYTWPWAVGVAGQPPPCPLDAAAVIERAAALGVRVVQLGDNLPLETLTDGDLHRLAAAAAAGGITLEMGTRGCAPEDLLAQLHRAEGLGARLLRVVVDRGEDRPSPAECHRRLTAVHAAFEAAGVTLAIENHDHFHVAELAGLVQKLASPWIGVCLDTANSLGAMETPAAAVRALAPWTVCLHLKDFRIARVPSQLGFVAEGTPAGEGQLDIPWILAEVRRGGREPSVILEQWPPFIRTLEATLRQEEEWARRSVAYLRTLLSH